MISEAERACLQVGFKQSLRALNENKVKKAFLAEDCEDKIKNPIKEACTKNDIQLFFIPTMSELGKLCGIEVKASCAVVLD